MEQEIKRHQEVQELQGQVQEVFIVAFQRKYTAERTIQVLQTMFDGIQDEQLHLQFLQKYNSGTQLTASGCYEHDGD